MRKPYDNALLHPKARQPFELLEKRLTDGYQAKLIPRHFRPFEGWRHPEDQRSLVRNGVSKAMPWQSAHNYGLAVDFVVYDHEAKKWSWDDKEPWDILDLWVSQCGLVRPIRWDRPHVVHPLWRTIERLVV